VPDVSTRSSLRALRNAASFARPTSYALVDALREETPPHLQYLIQDLFEDITLFSNRTLAATAVKRGDGRYDVTLEVEARKFKGDGSGKETEVPVDDWIDLLSANEARDAENDTSGDNYADSADIDDERDMARRTFWRAAATGYNDDFLVYGGRKGVQGYCEDRAERTARQGGAGGYPGLVGRRVGTNGDPEERQVRRLARPFRHRRSGHHPALPRVG